MPHDVFISYAAADKLTADACCARLEQGGVRCWIAPRDVVSGTDWSASIVDAIAASRVLVLVFSEYSNTSVQVKREVERAVSRGLAVLPIRIQDVPLSKHMEYFISTPHWLDALTPPLEAHLERLLQTVRTVLGQAAPVPAASESVEPPPRLLPPLPAPPAAASEPQPWEVLATAAIVGLLGMLFNLSGLLRNLSSALGGQEGFLFQIAPALRWLNLASCTVGLVGCALLLDGGRRVLRGEGDGLGRIATVALATGSAVVVWLVVSLAIIFASRRWSFSGTYSGQILAGYLVTALLAAGQFAFLFWLARRRLTRRVAA